MMLWARELKYLYVLIAMGNLLKVARPLSKLYLGAQSHLALHHGLLSILARLTVASACRQSSILSRAL